MNVLKDNLKSSDNKLEQINNQTVLESSHNRNVCKIPLNINPFDKSVNKYIKKLPKSTKCKLKLNTSIDFLTYIDSNNSLMINKTASDSVQCFYQFFNRKKYSDSRIVYQKSNQLSQNTSISMGKNEFVNVSCIRDNKKIYRSFHYIIPEKKEKIKPDNGYHPSVLIIVIESMSRINFIRHMNQTRTELEKLGNITYLKGLTKMADNSYPNMVPFLTGNY